MSEKANKVLGFVPGQLVFCNYPRLNPIEKTFPINSLCIVLGVHKDYHNMLNVYNITLKEFQGWYSRNLFLCTPDWKPQKDEKENH